MARKPSIRDVAEAAGVSVGTVSHYLNDRSVSKVRADRIKKAIMDLGFTSNALARGMRSQKSTVIGLCAPFTTFSNFSTLVDELEQNVSEANFEVMQVLSRHDPEREMVRVRRLADYKVRGMLLIPSFKPQQMLDFLYKVEIPTVIINRVMPEETRFDQVGVDHRGQTREIASRLIEEGHRSITFVARYPDLDLTRQRIDGLRDAVSASGQDVELEFIACGDVSSDYRDTLTKRLKSKDRPSYLILSNSRIAIWSVEVVRAANVEIGILTLDHPEWAEFVEPRISFVRQPNVEIAALAWRCLSERIENLDEMPKTILLNARIEWLNLSAPSLEAGKHAGIRKPVPAKKD